MPTVGLDAAADRPLHEGAVVVFLFRRDIETGCCHGRGTPLGAKRGQRRTGEQHLAAVHETSEQITLSLWKDL